MFTLFRRHPTRGIVLLIVFLVFIAGFFPIPLNTFIPRIEAQAVKLTDGDTVRIKSLTIQLWRGLSLHDVAFVSRHSKNPGIRLSVPRVLLSYRLLPLLWGKVDINTITVNSPLTEAVMAPGPAVSGKTNLNAPLSLPLGKIPLDLPVTIEIHDLIVKNANVNAELQPGMKIMARGVDVHLAASLDGAFSVKGRLSMDSLFAPHPFKLTDFESGLEFEPGKLKIADCSFDLYEGRCRLSATLDTAAAAMLKASFSLTGLHLAPLLKTARFDRGKVDGKVTVDMNMSGRTLIPNEWQGRGMFKASKIELSGLPFQNTLAALLFLPDLKNLKFDRITTSLSLAKGRLTTPDLNGSGNLMNITGAGYAGLDMYVSEKVRISLAPAMCARLPAFISQGIMLPTPDGRCAAGGELSGQLSDLSISLDSQTKVRAAATLLKGAGKLLQNLFRRR